MIVTAHKRSLGKRNVFTSVCLFREGLPPARSLPGGGGYACNGICLHGDLHRGGGSAYREWKLGRLPRNQKIYGMVEFIRLECFLLNTKYVFFLILIGRQWRVQNSLTGVATQNGAPTYYCCSKRVNK